MDDLALGTARLVALPATEASAAALQSLLDAEREYFRRVERRVPSPREAARLVADAEADPQRRLWLFAPREGGAPVAFLDLHLDYPEPGTAHVALLLVREPWQGRGLGREIVAALEAALAGSGATALRLSVVEDNLGARDFWERLGFAEVGRVGRGIVAYEKPLASG